MTSNKMYALQLKIIGSQRHNIACDTITYCWDLIYEGRTESHEHLFFACELGIADEGECGGRWNQLLRYP